MSCLHKCLPIELQMWDPEEPKANWTTHLIQWKVPAEVTLALQIQTSWIRMLRLLTSLLQVKVPERFLRGADLHFYDASLSMLITVGTSEHTHTGPALNPPQPYRLLFPWGPPVGRPEPVHPRRARWIKGTTRRPFKQVAFKRLNIKDVSRQLEKKMYLTKKKKKLHWNRKTFSVNKSCLVSTWKWCTYSPAQSSWQVFYELSVTSCVYLCALFLRLQRKQKNKRLCWWWKPMKTQCVSKHMLPT